MSTKLSRNWSQMEFKFSPGKSQNPLFLDSQRPFLPKAESHQASTFTSKTHETSL